LKRASVNLSTFIFLAILLGLCFYIIHSALWISNSIVFETKPTLSSVSDLKSMAADKTISLTSKDINTLINSYLLNIEKEGALQVEKVASRIEDNKISFCVSAKYHKIKLMLSTNGRLEYDGTVLSYYPDYFKLGKLVLPENIVYRAMKKYVAVNTEMGRIELKLEKLPFEIESLKIEEDKLEIIIKSSLPKSAPSNERADKTSPKIENIEEKIIPHKNDNEQSDTDNTYKKDLLKRTTSQLENVYSAAKTNNEKQLILLLKNVIDKMMQNENYAFKDEVTDILTRYENLTTSEKEDLKDAILTNMDMETLFELKNTFSL
jgi:hypothetical protein